MARSKNFLILDYRFDELYRQKLSDAIEKTIDSFHADFEENAYIRLPAKKKLQLTKKALFLLKKEWQPIDVHEFPSPSDRLEDMVDQIENMSSEEKVEYLKRMQNERIY